MSNIHKSDFLKSLEHRFGQVRMLPTSKSLISIGDDAARIYIRYSKVHEGGRTFFGLREMDLQKLEAHNSFLCFLLDNGSPPLFIPYADFEEIFRGAEVARDGQYKVQLLLREDGLDLYVARRGRFNVEGYVGAEVLERSLDARRLRQTPTLSHCQVQTLLAEIGHVKGYDVFVPTVDVGDLEWSLPNKVPLLRRIPQGYESVGPTLCEIDVVWVRPGRNSVEALFEVEHSTSIYSGLLRFNDLLLVDPRVSRFSIVSNEARRALFSRQLFRPTFKKSGLAELTSFLEYANVVDWHSRLVKQSQ